MLNELLGNGLPTEMAPGEPLYFLVSFKRRFADGLVIFWGPNAAGYTPDIKGAGAYTAAEAAKHEDAETVAVPVQWVHENCRIRMVIDQGDSHRPKNNIFWSASNLRDAVPNAKGVWLAGIIGESHTTDGLCGAVSPAPTFKGEDDGH